MTQYGFFIDQSRCIGCNACVISCKQWHNIPPGPVKFIRVYQWEKGNFPDIDLRVLPLMCFHCEDPACIKACRNGAIYKEGMYGAVLVDSGLCSGERECWNACPYGSPQFEGDEPGLKMSKCDMCIDRLEQGNKPICVLSCSMRALEFGPIDELREKYGDLSRLQEMPKASGAGKSSVVFKPMDRKTQVVKWDSKRALELWQKRHSENGTSLPDVFAKISDVTHVPQEIIGRNKLVLKARRSEDLMLNTMDDE
jgi:anaerobic dimethyl sulfoxide reductase subunit B (iron-sulfur subunit)